MNELIKLSGFELLKNEVEKELIVYQSVEVNGDESFKEAKKTRATLNKLKTAVDKQRKDIAKVLKTEVDSILELIDVSINNIDEKTSAWEEQLKQQRKLDIESLYFNLDSPISLDRLFDEKWLNITCDWQNEVTNSVDKLKRDIDVIKMISIDKELLDIYFEVLDVSLAKERYDKLHTKDDIKEYTVTFKSNKQQYDKVIEYIKSLGL